MSAPGWSPRPESTRWQSTKHDTLQAMSRDQSTPTGSTPPSVVPLPGGQPSTQTTRPESAAGPVKAACTGSGSPRKQAAPTAPSKG